MSKRVRFSRKALKKPDEFLTATDKALHYFAENRNTVYATAFGVAILLIAFLGVWYNQQAKASKMESMLVEMDKVRNQSGRQPDQIEADIEAYLQKFSEGAQNQRARLLLADTYYKNKNFEKAIQQYSSVTVKGSSGDLVYSLAQLGLAYSYEGRKEHKKSIEIYKAIIENKKTTLPLLPVYLDLARSYEMDNDPKSALLLLREIKNKFQSVADLEMIGKLINHLEKSESQADLK